ncbi:hypothetical protein NUSPORA_01558 [Nucleospora cyclopteri]
MSISLSSNLFVMGIFNVYMTFTHLFFVKNYFLEFNKRVISLISTRNKFVVALWNALFYSIPVICNICVQANGKSQKEGSFSFVAYLVPLCIIISSLSHIIKMPDIKGLVLLNVFLCAKDIIFTFTTEYSNSFLDLIALIFAFVIFICILINKIMIKRHGERNGMRENFRYLSRNIIPLRESISINRQPVSEMYERRPDEQSVNEETVQKYFNLFFYHWEVVFDNLFLYQMPKSKLHVLTLSTRAILSPVAVTILICAFLKVQSVMNYLIMLSISLAFGIVNLILSRNYRYYKILMGYNFLLIGVVELLLAIKAHKEAEYVKSKYFKGIITDFIKMIQVIIPVAALAVKNKKEGLEGISITAITISYTINLILQGVIYNIIRILRYKSPDFISKRISSGAELLAAIVPFSMSQVSFGRIYKDIAMPIASLLPFYYFLIHKGGDLNKRS